LGSPRVITDSNGQVISRRDFMPFGEEIVNNIGERASASLKYNVADSVRQKFTGYQKDEETQLDFAEARMYENRHGRFTAVDPLLASGKSANPQSFNRFVYCQNRPLVLTDPTGQFGDYYNRQGQYIGSDDKNDGKKYYADVTRREGDTAWINNIQQIQARPNRTTINSLSGNFTQSVSNTATAFGGTAYNALAGFDNLIYGGLDRLNFEYIATGRPGNNFPRVGYWEPKNEEQAFASTVYTGASFFIPFGEASLASRGNSFAGFTVAASTRTAAESTLSVAPAPRIVFSGHGFWDGSGLFTVPEGSSFTTYSPLGTGIRNSLGNAIEANTVPAGAWRETFEAGSTIPDFTLSPINASKVQGNPLTVTRPTKLSELLKPNMGECHWAACSNIILPNPIRTETIIIRPIN
jgi:RHS repeat-associated protein